MKKFNLLLLILILTTASSIFSENNLDCYKPKNGFVPNKETALKIAEAVWLPIYGKSIYNEKPFKATLLNGQIWQVEGTLKMPKIQNSTTLIDGEFY